MLQLIIALILGFSNPSHTPNNNTPATTADTPAPDSGEETGGDIGHIPPKKP